LAAPPAAAATFTVNSTVDAVDAVSGNGVCADATGACTLRAAVMETNALAGADEVFLPSGTYVLSLSGTGEDASATGDLDVLDDLTLIGAGPSVTTIDGNRAEAAVELHKSDSGGGRSVAPEGFSVVRGLGAAVRASTRNPVPTLLHSR
jgi:CSLREA domain-containing protein